MDFAYRCFHRDTPTTSDWVYGMQCDGELFHGWPPPESDLGTGFRGLPVGAGKGGGGNPREKFAVRRMPSLVLLGVLHNSYITHVHTIRSP